MDLLGFSAALLRDDTAPKDADGIIVRYENVFTNVKDIYNSKDSDVKFLWMSDTLMFSTDASHFDKLLPYLFEVSNRMLAIGLPVRGAICVGNLYHEENIWGEAIARAANAEKKVAVYPRIVVSLDDYSKLSIPAEYKKYFIGDEENPEYIYVNTLAYELDKQIKKDKNGEGTVLSSKLNVLCKEIDENRKEEAIAKKWNWLAEQEIKNLNERRADIQDILKKEKEKSKIVEEFSAYIDKLSPSKK